MANVPAIGTPVPEGHALRAACASGLLGLGFHACQIPFYLNEITGLPGRGPGSGETVEPRDLVVIGGSAGSLTPLRQLVAALPRSLPAAVAVTIHVSDQGRSHLPPILARTGPLPAAHARAGESLRPGRIYVAPPGCHLLVPGGTAELSNGARINRTRPAVDALFGSAARWFGDRVVAVVLSGVLDDGAVGAALVGQAGGLVVVQDPEEAAQRSMPLAALAAAPATIIRPAAELGKVISSMLGESGLAGWSHTEPPQVGEATMQETSDLQFLSPGETGLTRLTCPDCGGALAEGVLPNVTYYRCHVGHQFGPRSLAAAQADTAEAKLWGAVAALEETAALGRHLAAQAPPGDDFAEERNGTAAWATDLASTVREHIRNVPRAGAPGADAPSE